MTTTRSSRTAQGVALVRAIETRRPADRRICNDPYARAFVSGLSVTLSKLVIDSGLYARLAPGAVEFVIVRERAIDDQLKTCLSEGLDQVVLLGAGFDTRAYRIPGIEKTRVFEVDQPATQAVKRERLKKVIDSLPAQVTFVGIDFNRQSLGERLQAAGYDERGKTLFIWQGVTYFLTPQGVDNTLAFIAQHSGPGSAVIFDYYTTEALRDTGRPDVKMMQRVTRMTGEAYLFGIGEGQIETFLTERGFHDIRNLPLTELGKRYFTGPNAGRVLPSGIAIVSARVSRTEA